MHGQAVNERFNRTLQDEFISFGNMTADTAVFNHRLTEWLVEYNFRRPHQALGYLPPMNFTFKYHKVLPMYPSSTTALQLRPACYGVFMKDINSAANWRTYYVSPRMNQIQAVLFSEGIVEPQLGRLVQTIDRIASGLSNKPLWITGRRHWVLFTRGRFLRIRRRQGRRRPRFVRSSGSTSSHPAGDRHVPSLQM